MAHLIGETERTKQWPVAVTMTKLQALELAKEWLDEYRKAGNYWDEDRDEEHDPQAAAVADRLESEILLERQREKGAARVQQVTLASASSTAAAAALPK